MTKRGPENFQSLKKKKERVVERIAITLYGFYNNSAIYVESGDVMQREAKCFQPFLMFSHPGEARRKQTDASLILIMSSVW